MVLRERRKNTAAYPGYWAVFLLSLIPIFTLLTCSTKNLTGVQKTGSIFVNSNPSGADIIVDKTLTGKTTPDAVSHVPVGDHTVSVKLSGYLVSPDSVMVTVDEDRTDTVEFILLETDKGSLGVSSNVEGATICIDNEPQDQVTPHVFFNSVSVGTHIISVFKEGYSNENPTKEIVTIATGDTAEVDFILNPLEVGKDIGNITPDFDLPDADNVQRRLYAYRGFVTMINFWAEDCTYCMKLLPYLQDIYADYLSDTLFVFGINYGGDFGQEGLDVVRRIRDEYEIDFTLLVGAGTSVKSDFQITDTPVTIILDRGGKIYYYVPGFYSFLPDRLRLKLNELFGK
jgi:thiol-disulfide isomerase/thioredoxin